MSKPYPTEIPSPAKAGAQERNGWKESATVRYDHLRDWPPASAGEGR
ncbi:MAG: hypothetical protein WCS75_01910 [Sphingomonas sp.]